MMLITQDGTVIVVDEEVGTASGRTAGEAWAEIRQRKADKTAREFLKARDMVLAHSVGVF
jgi:hypothetical protein